jgi:hypothetical protein
MKIVIILSVFGSIKKKMKLKRKKYGDFFYKSNLPKLENYFERVNQNEQ